MPRLDFTKLDNFLYKRCNPLKFDQEDEIQKHEIWCEEPLIYYINVIRV